MISNKQKIKILIKKILSESDSEDLKKSKAGNVAARRRQESKSSKYLEKARENSKTFRGMFSPRPPGKIDEFLKDYIDTNIGFGDAVNEFKNDNPEDGKEKEAQLKNLLEEDFKSIGEEGVKGLVDYVNEMNKDSSRELDGRLQKIISDFIELRQGSIHLEKSAEKRSEKYKNIEKFVGKSATQLEKHLSPEDQKKLKSLRDEYAIRRFLRDKLKLPKSIAGVDESLDRIKYFSNNRHLNEYIFSEFSRGEYFPTMRSMHEISLKNNQKHSDVSSPEEMGPSETGVFDAPDEEHPGYMLLGNLKRIAAKAAELADLASPWDDAEPWIESKINSAAEHIDAIHDYIMYSVLDQKFNPQDHEDMMYECGEMSGDLMSEPMHYADLSKFEMIGGRNFGDGGSAQMARGQLFQIAKKSQSISDRLTDDDTLPEWLQSKVAMAYQTISTISDYLEYKMMRQETGDPVFESRKIRRSR